MLSGKTAVYTCCLAEKHIKDENILQQLTTKKKIKLAAVNCRGIPWQLPAEMRERYDDNICTLQFLSYIYV